MSEDTRELRLPLDLDGYRAETERLLLRPYAFDDLAAMHDMHARPDVCRYLPWDVPHHTASRRRMGRHQAERLAVDGDGVVLAAFERATGRLVADFCLFLRSVEHRGGELGYIVHPDAQGRGYATEGARHVLGLAFDTVGLRRVTGRLDARNTASAAVLTRLGMRHEARLVQNEWFKGEWGDEDQFAILREEWDQQAR
jgi:RimJ/RimL family protein N-acetyltransferase